MKTRVFIVRHTETIGNVEKRLTGRQDYEITERGQVLIQKLTKELEKIKFDRAYSSTSRRAIKTIEPIVEKQNLKINLDNRLDERRRGRPNDDIYPDCFTKQFLDENFKTVGGESQKDVRKRMDEVISEIIKNNKGKRIALFSHGYAIIYYLLKYCKLISINADRNITFSFNDKVVFDKKISAPEVFKLVFDSNDKVISIENLEFDDLK